MPREAFQKLCPPYKFPYNPEKLMPRRFWQKFFYVNLFTTYPYLKRILKIQKQTESLVFRGTLKLDILVKDIKLKMKSNLATLIVYKCFLIAILRMTKICQIFNSQTRKSNLCLNIPIKLITRSIISGRHASTKTSGFS